MAKSSINIQPVKANSETHNLRLKDYKHVEKMLSDQNFSWGTENKISEIRKEIEQIYKEKVGQRMQRKATPIREGVFLIERNHTNEEVLNVAQNIANKYGLKVLQLHIHRDEGHHKSKPAGEPEWKPNLHAHVIFEWFNRDTGRTVKLGREDMANMQTDFASELSMERGKKSLRTHLSPFEYKIKLAEEKLENIQKKEFDVETEIQILKNEFQFLKNDILELQNVKSEILSKREKIRLAAFENLAKKYPKINENLRAEISEIRKQKNGRKL